MCIHKSPLAYTQMMLCEHRLLPQEEADQSTGSSAGGAGDCPLLSSTNSVLYVKHLLSDLWRVFDIKSRWLWTDQERTKGKGNATLSTESDSLVLKVKSYNVKTGFVKKVSVTLELVDILQAKMKF
jgi:hypothetical protein